MSDVLKQRCWDRGQEILRLKQQIEAMKNCRNCKHGMPDFCMFCTRFFIAPDGNLTDKWQLRE